MPTDSVDLGGDQEMYIFLSSLDDSDIQPGLESLLFGICLHLPQKIFFLTVLGIPLSSKFFFSFFFFLSQPGFQWVFNLFPPCNYPCQGHHHFFLILLNSSAALDQVLPGTPSDLKYVQLLITTRGLSDSQVLPSQLLFRLHLPVLTPGSLPGALAGFPFLTSLHSVAR